KGSREATGPRATSTCTCARRPEPRPPEASACLAQAFQRVLVIRLEAERAAKRGAGFRLLAELELAPADPVVEPVPVGRRADSLPEEGEGIPVPAEVVEGPGDLGPDPGHLRGLGAEERLEASQRGLERRQRLLVTTELELCGPEASQRVHVVGVAV